MGGQRGHGRRLLSSSAPRPLSLSATSSDGDDHRGGLIIATTSPLSLPRSVALRLLLLRIFVIWRRKRNKLAATSKQMSATNERVVESKQWGASCQRAWRVMQWQWDSREIYSAPLQIGMRLLRPDRPRVGFGAFRR